MSYNVTNETEVNFLKQIASDIELSISIFGFIANLFCVIVFSRINDKFHTNGQMYKYFLMKSILDFMIFIIFLIKQIEYRSPDNIHYNFWFQVFDLYFYHFFELLFKIYSVYFEILATIDCYLSIEKKYQHLLTKKAFYITSSFNLIFFFIFYFGKLFVYKIVPFGDLYRFEKTYLYFNYFYKTLTILFLIFRDVIGTFLMVSFNVLIFLSLKKLTERKKTLRNNDALVRSIEAEQNKVKMIYFSTINFIVFHFPDVIYNIYGKFSKSKFWPTYLEFSNFIINLSFATPFIIYILFNKTFRFYFMKLIRMKQSGRSYITYSTN
jgi:hypothetical protein